MLIWDIKKCDTCLLSHVCHKRLLINLSGIIDIFSNLTQFAERNFELGGRDHGVIRRENWKKNSVTLYKGKGIIYKSKT